MPIKATFIGHATVLVECGNTKFLTDPYFNNSLFMQKRKISLPININDLEPPNVILLSHLHLDHFDINSFKYIPCKVPIVCPSNTSGYIRKYLANPTIEIDYYASHTLPTGEQITALPAVHSGGRLLPFSLQKKASSYIVKCSNGCFYFCGDSGYGKHFQEAGLAYKIDLAILPIGGYLPKIIQKWHMDPQSAVNAYIDLKARHMLPVHHSTFRITMEESSEPRRWLENIINENPNLAGNIHNILPGESVIIEN